MTPRLTGRLGPLARTVVLAAVLACAQQAPAHAGTNCEPKPLAPATIRQGMDVAAKVYRTLEESDAEVALIARVGQDLGKYGLRYSHMAYVWRDHPKGRWLVVHELNQCGAAQSTLFDEGLGNFFLDDMFAYEALVVVPAKDEQRKLAQMLAARSGLHLHEPRYNMLSYAFATQYQNSNQWVLETYAAAVSDKPDSTRAQAQAWLKWAGYAPVTVQIDAPTRLGARMFKANVAFDDHPFGRRMAGQIDTVTVESIRRFIHARDPAARDIIINL